MAPSASSRAKINTDLTQRAVGVVPRRKGRTGSGGTSRARPRIDGDARQSSRDTARVVVELEDGITVYPPEAEGEPWRAVFVEDGRRRYRQAMSEAKLAVKLAKVTERLRADAPGMDQMGAALITHYLDPDRLPVAKRWSRKHADTQRRLCERFAAPVIAAIRCQDIAVADMQKIVSSAPTASEGDRLHRCVSAMVTAGIQGGYLVNPRLREVHWRAAGRPVPEPKPTIAGESALWVGPGEIPSSADITRLGHALARGPRGELYELMAHTAAYTGLRQGELFALTISQIDQPARVITVDRKLIEVAGSCTSNHPRAANTAAPSTPSAAPRATPSRKGSKPGSPRPAPNSRLAPTPAG
jgi:hypothetical protein